jgi:hypothetical protein
MMVPATALQESYRKTAHEVLLYSISRSSVDHALASNIFSLAAVIGNEVGVPRQPVLSAAASNAGSAQQIWQASHDSRHGLRQAISMC